MPSTSRGGPSHRLPRIGFQLSVAAALVLFGCHGSGKGDGGVTDSGTHETSDSGASDSGVNDAGSAALQLEPSSWNFGDVDAGLTVSTSFTLRNVGTQPVDVAKLSFGGLSAGLSLDAGDCIGPLSLDAGCSLAVTFAPVGNETPNASLIASNADNSVQSDPATITGRGIDQVTLSISVTGDGGVSGPGGLSCSGSCSVVERRYGQVTLSAAPNFDSTFAGWSGDCSGTGSCIVTMDVPRSVTADFALKQLKLMTTITPPDGGSLAFNPPGTSCGSGCTQYPYGTDVALVPTPSKFFIFSGWQGACADAGAACPLTLTSDESVGANFARVNVAFVTSDSYLGNLGGITGADTKCTAAAQDAGLSGNFVAWLGTTPFNMETTAASRIGNARGWVRMDGLPFMDKLTDVTGTFYPLDLDEHGNKVTDYVWTGTLETGDAGSENCNQWNSTSVTLGGTSGYTTGGGGYWTHELMGGGACYNPQHLYCFENDYQQVVRPRPPPQVAYRFFLSRETALGDWNGLEGADSICQQDAIDAGIAVPGQTFLALLPGSDSATAPLAYSFTYFRVDGVALANLNELGGGNLRAAPDVTANGQQPYDGYYSGVWTGGVEPAFLSAQTCSGGSAPWTSTSDTSASAFTGNYGFSDVQFYNFTFGPNTCAQGPYRIYCVENGTLRDGGTPP